MFKKLRKILGFSKQNMIVRTSSDYQLENESLTKKCEDLEKARQNKQEEVWAQMEITGRVNTQLDNALEDINNLLEQNRQLVQLSEELTEQFKELFGTLDKINKIYTKFTALPNPQPLKSKEELEEWKRDLELQKQLENIEQE